MQIGVAGQPLASDLGWFDQCSWLLCFKAWSVGLWQICNVATLPGDSFAWQQVAENGPWKTAPFWPSRGLLHNLPTWRQHKLCWPLKRMVGDKGAPKGGRSQKTAPPDVVGFSCRERALVFERLGAARPAIRKLNRAEPFSPSRAKARGRRAPCQKAGASSPDSETPEPRNPTPRAPGLKPRRSPKTPSASKKLLCWRTLARATKSLGFRV